MKLRHTLLALALAAPLSLLAMADGIPAAAPAAPSGTAAEPARPDKPLAAPFETTRQQAETAAVVYGLLSGSRYAYRPLPLDGTVAAEVWEKYLDSLDPSKVYLSAEDVASFGNGGDIVVAALKSGRFNPFYNAYLRYRERVLERLARNRALLNEDIFRFDGDDRFDYDREDSAWAKSQDELDAYWRQSVRYDWLRLRLAGKSDADIRKTLDKRYATSIGNMDDFHAEDVFQIALGAYTQTVDPHTDYFNPRTAERFNQQMSLSLEGIGAQLQKRDDIITVMELIPGGPAARDGRLKSGDRIVAVGQGDAGPMEDVIGWRIDDVVAKIKGDKGTVVRLDILPAGLPLDGQPRRIQLVRDKVVMEESRAKQEVLELAPAVEGERPRRIGVIKLPSFYQDFQGRRSQDGEYVSASRDVARILGEFRAAKVDGVVLDLRHNGGGSLDEAVRMTGLFIDQGPVVMERQVGGRVNTRSDSEGGVAWDGPLAVLINRASASSSEIVAGALQDYGRALVIGENSFGKGTVQAVVSLDRVVQGRSGGGRYGDVKMTIAQFFLPSGRSTQNKGISPDIAFPSSLDEEDYGENTYDNALPWAQIDAAAHTRYGQFAPLLPQLQQRHQARVAQDVEYQWKLEDAEEFKTEREKKWVSLNEAERRAERERNEARRTFRQAERQRLGLALDPLSDVRADDGLNRSERDIASEVERDKLAEKVPDPYLREAAAILSDAAWLLQHDGKLASEVVPRASAPGLWTERASL